MPSLAQSQESFRLYERSHVVRRLVLRERREGIKWLEDHQIEEGVKRLAGEKRVTPFA